MKKLVFFSLAALLLCCGCAARYDSIEQAEAEGARLGEFIYIDGVDVSRLSPAEAVNKVRAAHEETLSGTSYVLRAGDDRATVSGAELPICCGAEEAVLSALMVRPHLARDGMARKLSSAVTADAEELRSALSRAVKQLEYPSTPAKAQYDAAAEGRFSYTPASAGRSIDVPDLANRLSELIQGRSGGEIEAAAISVEPEYTEEMARQDTQLICEFTTSFAGSTYSRANRVFNIVKAAALIDGVTIAPDEEFDMNATLGPRNGENGWKQATGIRDGAYVQEYGGGVCQVSTTLYNAALMADLDITERHHHSWPLGYIDIGRDATISTGGPNFRLVNPHDAPVTISASTDEKQKTVTVRLYGRPLADGVRIELTSRKTSTLAAPGQEVTVDRSLAPGAVEIVRRERRGSTAETYKLYYDANGELIRQELVTTDKYRSIKGLVKIGG